MKVLAVIAGVALILIILWDAFETVILPRRVTRRLRLTTLFYESIWKPWAGSCSLVLVGVEGMPKWQAQLTFAMARHAVADITQIFKTTPTAPESCLTRLRPGELERIREILASSGAYLSDGEEGEEKLTQLRLMYEPYVCALSEMFLMTLPPWIVSTEAIDNWKTSAWGRIQ